MEMDLLDKIDELNAKAVTAEQFKKVWGVTIEEQLKELLGFVEGASLKEE